MQVTLSRRQRMSSSRAWMTSGSPSLASAGRTPSSSVAYLMAWDLLFVATQLFPYHLLLHHVQLLLRHLHFLSRSLHHLGLLYQEQQRQHQYRQQQEQQQQQQQRRQPLLVRPPPRKSPTVTNASLPWEQPPFPPPPPPPPPPPSLRAGPAIPMMPHYHQHQYQHAHRGAAAAPATMRGPGPSATRPRCTPIKLDYCTKHKSEAVWHMVHNEYPDGLTAERFLETIKQLCVDHGNHVRSARNRGAFTTDDVVIQFVRRVWHLGPVEVWVDLGRRTTVSLKWQLATMQNGWDDDWLHVKYHF